MKKVLSILLFILIFSINTAYAKQKIKIDSVKINKNYEYKVSTEEIFNFFAEKWKTTVPSSYKYINVNYKDVEKWTKLEDSLKKLIYLDLIKNPKLNIWKNKKLNSRSFYRLSEKIFWIDIDDKKTKKQLQKTYTNKNDLQRVSNLLENETVDIYSTSTDKNVNQKIRILKDVYSTLTWLHYDKNSINESKLLDSAIKWLTSWIEDEFTVYFPPVESQTFYDSLAWNYEWIGSYVDMLKPWELKIVSPIPWSPSEKAWLMWWDQVLKVDWKEVTNINSLREVITWIKGPAGSKVILTIKRNNKIFDVEVTRAKIVLKDVEHKSINTTTYYIQIKSFWENVDKDFKWAIEEINKNKNIDKIIIDLRNNWWGYLHKVANILSYFVEKWENTAVVKYPDFEKSYTSKWYNLIDFSKYKIFILQNSGTASASEIMIGTIKDYYKDVKLIWTKTYWKWSVQAIKPYVDWSSLKYTIAKWFTWKTQTGIDWIWITPTLELEFDIEKYKNNWFDNQLDKAIFLNK